MMTQIMLLKNIDLKRSLKLQYRALLGIYKNAFI